MKNQIFSIITALFLSACSLVNEPYQDCPLPEKEDSVSLILEMKASGSVTRYDDRNHDEVDSEYRQLEDGINFKDLGLFVFARLMSKPEEEEKLVLKITDITSSTNDSVYIAGVPGDYTVTMDIPRSKLNKILFGDNSGLEINPNSSDLILFRILIMANCTALQAGSESDVWTSINGTTFQNVITQLSDWNYDMSNLYNGDLTKVDVEGLYTHTRKNIPMFGTNRFDVTQKALYESRNEKRLLLGRIDLLRALAKVRIVDNIENKNEEGYPKVVKAEFIGSKSKALQLPSGALSYVNGTQVHTANIFDDKVLTSTDTTYTYRLGNIPSDITTVDSTERKGIVLGGFVPEQRIGYVNNNLGGTGLPGFRITVSFLEGQESVYTVPMTGYRNQSFDFNGDNILRNHIYTLSVEKADFPESQLTIEVIEAPYNSVSLNPSFGDLYYPEPEPEQPEE